MEKALEVGASIVGASAMTHTTALNIRALRDLIDARCLRGRVKLAAGGAYSFGGPSSWPRSEATERRRTPGASMRSSSG